MSWGPTRKVVILPTWQDIEVLESVNKAVKPLQEFTDALMQTRLMSVSPTLNRCCICSKQISYSQRKIPNSLKQ